MTSYNPHDFLRRINKPLLGQLLAKQNLLKDQPWDTMPSRDDQPVLKAWDLISEQDKERQERIFRKIWHLGRTNGISIAIDEAQTQNLNIAEDLERVPGLLSKAMWIYLNHPSLFDRASEFLIFEAWGRRSRWKRNDLPLQTEPHLDVIATEALRSQVSAFYKRTEGCSKHCTIHALRRGEMFYWFLYPEDHSEEHLNYGDDGEEPETIILHPAFQVIFAFSPANGCLEVCARTKAEGRETLEAIFANTILHVQLPEQVTPTPVYTLQCLLDRNHTFSHVEGIAYVRVRTLRCQILGAGTKSRTPLNTFDAGLSDEPQDIHKAIDRLIGVNTPRGDKLHVVSATIQVFLNDCFSNGKRKHVDFTISIPDGCNLDDDPIHALIRASLVEWKLEVPHAATNAPAA